MGVVTRRGSLPNAAMAKAARDAAERTAGETAVREELTFPHHTGSGVDA